MRDILDPDDQPGQGNRYHIDSKDIKRLKKKFDKWQRPKSRTNGQGAVPTRIPDEEGFLENEVEDQPGKEGEFEDFDPETIGEPSEDQLEDIELEM